MKNRLTSFEKAVKQSLDNLDFSRESGNWDDLSNRLDQTATGTSQGMSTGAKWLIGIVAAAGLTAVIWTQSDTEAENIEESTQLTEQVIPSPVETEGDSPSESVQEQIEPIRLNEKPFIEPVEFDGSTGKDESGGVKKEDSNKETQPQNPETEASQERTEERGLESDEPQIAQDASEAPEIKEPKIFAINEPVCDILRLPYREGIDYKAAGLKRIRVTDPLTGDSYSEFEGSKGQFVIQAIDIATGRVLQEETVQFKGAPTVSFSHNRMMENGMPMTKFELDAEAPGVDYRWNFGDGTYGFDSEASHLFKKQGSYEVRLMAEDENGCVTHTTETIYIDEDYNLLAPNSFSPNGDGVNDEWIPRALEVTDREFTLEIMDLRGQVVFRTTRPDLKWNGRINNSGSNVNVGEVYQWRAVVQNPEGGFDDYAGTIRVFGN